MATPENLSYRQLNRALLARQHLLERVDTPAPEMVTWLIGMQAQSPDAPYLGLWNRIRDFDLSGISAMVTDRRMIRLTTLRGTIHLHPLDEALWIRPILQSMLMTRVFGAQHRRDLNTVSAPEVTARARAILTEHGSLTRAQLGKYLNETWPDRDGAAMAFLSIVALPTEQAAPRGVWRARERTRWRLIPEVQDWPERFRAERADELVRRYIRAFGPASLRDVARWSGLRGVRAIMDRLDPEMRTYRSPAGETLYDLADGTLTPEDLAAPVRLLPEFDNVLLSHHDRGRIFDHSYGPPVVAGDGARGGTLLIDGAYRGTWGVETGRPATKMKPATTTIVTIAPFLPMATTEKREVEEELARVMAFILPHVEDWDIEHRDPGFTPGIHGLR